MAPITNAYASYGTANPNYYTVGDWQTATTTATATSATSMTYPPAAYYTPEQQRLYDRRARAQDAKRMAAKMDPAPVKPPTALDWLRRQVAETCASAQLTPAL